MEKERKEEKLDNGETKRASNLKEKKRRKKKGKKKKGSEIKSRSKGVMEERKTHPTRHEPYNYTPKSLFHASSIVITSIHISLN